MTAMDGGQCKSNLSQWISVYGKQSIQLGVTSEAPSISVTTEGLFSSAGNIITD